jgi:hypothetical protein
MGRRKEIEKIPYNSRIFIKIYILKMAELSGRLKGNYEKSLCEYCEIYTSEIFLSLD